MKILKFTAAALILASTTSVNADWDMPFFGNNNGNDNNWNMPFFGNNSNDGFGNIMNDMTGNMDMNVEMKFKMKAKAKGNSNANNYWNNTNYLDNGYYGTNGYAPYGQQSQQHYAPAPASAAQ